MKNSSKKLDALILSGVFMLFSLIASCSYAQPVQIKVDSARELGPGPELFSSSVWIQEIRGPEDYIYGKFFQDNSPAVIQMTLPVLRETKSFGDFKEALRKYTGSEAARTVFRNIQEKNITLIIGFDPCPMPTWLSSHPGDRTGVTSPGDWAKVENCCPPRDYGSWAEVIRYTLGYFRKGLKVRNLGYYVGHEQELQWVGSEEDFFRYYEQTAKAVKAAGSDIKVGGVGPAIWNKRKYDCDCYSPDVRAACREQGGWKEPGDQPFLKDFIDYAGRKKIPVDFINLHSFGTFPPDFLKVAGTVDGWLSAAGMAGTPIYVSDWTFWNGAYPNASLDTNESAAYIPQALYYMWKGGVAWHGHDFNVKNPSLEKSAGAATTFTGDWPIFTKDYILKPSYNAFRALTIFAGDRGKLRMLDAVFPPDRNIVALASRQGDERVSVLASYFLPGQSSRMFRTSFLVDLLKQERFFGDVDKDIDSLVDCATNKPGNRSRAEHMKYCRDTVLSGKAPEKRKSLEAVLDIYSALNAPDPLGGLQRLYNKAGDERIKKKISLLEAYLTDLYRPEKVDIDISGLPFSGKAVVSAYLIDDGHGNACSANRMTARANDKLKCGAGGVIDREVSDAKLAALRDAVDALLNNMSGRGMDAGKADEYRRQAEGCLSKGTFNEAFSCLKNKIKNSRGNGLKSVLPEAARNFWGEYARAAERINASADVALEASREPVEITPGRGYVYETVLKPNTVLLLVIKKDNR